MLLDCTAFDLTRFKLAFPASCLHFYRRSRAADAHAALSPQVISNRPHAARDAQPAKELSTDEALDAIYADAVQAHARMGNLDLGRSLPVLNHAAEINAQNHNSVALSMDSSVRTLHWGIAPLLSLL